MQSAAVDFGVIHNGEALMVPGGQRSVQFDVGALLRKLVEIEAGKDSDDIFTRESFGVSASGDGFEF